MVEVTPSYTMLEARGRRDIRAARSVNLHPATCAQNTVPVLENGGLLYAVLADTHLFLPERYFGVCLPAIHPLTFVIRWTPACDDRTTFEEVPESKFKVSFVGLWREMQMLLALVSDDRNCRSRNREPTASVTL